MTEATKEVPSETADEKVTHQAAITGLDELPVEHEEPIPMAGALPDFGRLFNDWSTRATEYNELQKLCDRLATENKEFQKKTGDIQKP